MTDHRDSHAHEASFGPWLWEFGPLAVVGMALLVLSAEALRGVGATLAAVAGFVPVTAAAVRFGWRRQSRAAPAVRVAAAALTVAGFGAMAGFIVTGNFVFFVGSFGFLLTGGAVSLWALVR